MASNMMNQLLDLMATLRDPERGCPWDIEQTFETIAPYTIEEAYKVLDAIERGNLVDLKGELGDLLLQVVFHARIAEEAGAFAFEDVVETIVAKLIRRHPHVFDARGRVLERDGPRPTLVHVDDRWRLVKEQERADRPASLRSVSASLLGDVAQALPALMRAQKVSRHAADHGFDWPDATSVIGKVREEVDEVSEALSAGDSSAVAEEIGDLLFSVANLARHAGVDPESALRAGTAKFERRFAAMARHLAEQGTPLADSDLAAMEAAWAAVKRDEAGKT